MTEPHVEAQSAALIMGLWPSLRDEYLEQDPAWPGAEYWDRDCHISPNGSILSSTTGSGTMTRRRSNLMAAGAALHVSSVLHSTESGATYVTGCWSNLAK